MSCRNAFTLLIAIILLLAGLKEARSASTYRRNHQLRPIRMSYQDLSALVARLNRLIDEVNAGHDAPFRTRSLEVEGDGIRIEATDELTTDAFANAPPIAKSVDYHYTNRGAPISAVFILLRDTFRSIRVEGTSREQVDATTAML